MKLIEQKEPRLGSWMRPKNQKRKSYKSYTIIRNRSFRRELNRNFEVGKEILRMKYGWEY